MASVRHTALPHALDYSPTQVADLGLLGMGRTAIYDRVKDGRIRTFEDDYGHKRISAKEIERIRALMRQQEQANPDEWEERQRRREIARSGGLANLAKNGREKVGQQLMAGKMSALERQVDPMGILSPEERRQRALDLNGSQLSRARAKLQEMRRLKKLYGSEPA